MYQIIDYVVLLYWLETVAFFSVASTAVNMVCVRVFVIRKPVLFSVVRSSRTVIIFQFL